MKKFDEEENENFFEEEYFNFEELGFGEEKTFWKNFWQAEGVAFTKLKLDFRKIFIKASSSQNLKNSGFWPIFQPIFSYKESRNFWYIDLEYFSEKF